MVSCETFLLEAAGRPPRCTIGPDDIVQALPHGILEFAHIARPVMAASSPEELHCSARTGAGAA